MTQTSEFPNAHQDVQQELRDAGSCLAMGAGVGAVGTISAVLIGATCPICVVMAPALIGMGLVKGYAARRKRLTIQAADVEAGLQAGRTGKDCVL